MDPATIIGLLLAFGAMFAMLYMEGSQASSILLPAPMILVFFGTLAVGLASGTVRDAISSFKALPSAFRGPSGNPRDLVEQLVGLADIARRDGLLALEAEVANTKDPFVARALQALADGTDAEDLRDMLEDEIASRERSAAVASRFFNTLGGYAPTVGIIGTVVSLTHVLENLSKPDELGHMIAAAFVATLWGLVSANFIWLPLGARLSRMAQLDSERLDLAVEGIMAIQSGTSSLLLRDKLEGMLPAGKDSKSKNASDEDDFQVAA